MDRKAKKTRTPRRPKRLNRSRAGNFAIFAVLFFFGLYSLLPMVMSVNQAFKPMSELYLFPPKIFVRNPTGANFITLFALLADSQVPFSR